MQISSPEVDDLFSGEVWSRSPNIHLRAGSEASIMDTGSKMPDHEHENGHKLSAQDPEGEKDAPEPEGDVFGGADADGVRYKVLSWWKCGSLMIAETVSLGVLSLPAAVASMGLAPGLIVIVALGLLATYSGYAIWQFKMRHPHVVNMADAGAVIGKTPGRVVFGAAQLLLTIFVMGGHLLTFRVAMNSITNHGTCSIVFGVVGLVVVFMGNIPRTLNNVSWLSVISCISILAAMLICMIGLGVVNEPASIQAATDNSLTGVFPGVTNIVVAFSGHVAYFGFISEMEQPRDFPKALYLLQATEISLYVIISVVIYYYAGNSVASPALGSMDSVLRKVSYGIALPTIIVAGVIYGHVASKQIYVTVWAGKDRIQKRDALALGSWYGIALFLWIIAWIIAEGIPVFNDLLSLIGALLCSWISYGIPGMLWLYMNFGKYLVSKRKVVLTALNVGLIGVGICLCALGLWASGKAIHENSSGQSFSCANDV